MDIDLLRDSGRCLDDTRNDLLTGSIRSNGVSTSSSSSSLEFGIWARNSSSYT